MTENERPNDMPLPLEIADADDATTAVFGPAGPTMETGLGAVFMWWTALKNLPEYRVALENLTYNPADWGGYEQTVRDFDGWSFMSVPYDRPEPDDDIEAIKFMRDTGHTMRAFADAPMREDMLIVTAVRCPDGLWRVWGYSRNEVPSNNRIRFGTD